jgi:hypothetical protein
MEAKAGSLLAACRSTMAVSFSISAPRRSVPPDFRNVTSLMTGIVGIGRGGSRIVAFTTPVPAKLLASPSQYGFAIIEAWKFRRKLCRVVL